MAINQCNFSDVFVLSYLLTFTALLNFQIQCNRVYFSSTEHNEALAQQDKPNVYDCINNKEG